MDAGVECETCKGAGYLELNLNDEIEDWMEE